MPGRPVAREQERKVLKPLAMNRKDLAILALMFAALLAAPRALAQPAPATSPDSPAQGSAPAQPQPPVPPAPPSSGPNASDSGWPLDPCLKLENSTLANAIRDLSIQVGGETRTISDMRLTGLTHLDEAQVWRLVGPKPKGTLSLEQATLLLTRLSQTGLFSKLTPTLRVDPNDGAILDVAVIEQPTITRIVLNGLTESDPAEFLAVMFNAPGLSHHKGKDGDDDDNDKDDEDEDEHHVEVTGRCLPPTPPRAWLAQGVGSTLQAGIVRGGLTPALDRAIDHLWDAGYLLASLTADWSPDGTLVVNVDEGHLRELNIVGVSPELEPQVRRELGLQPGQVFLLADLEHGVDRVRERLPFLHAHVRGRSLRSTLQVNEQLSPDGARHYGLGVPTDNIKRVDVQISVDGGDAVHLRFSGAPWDWSSGDSRRGSRRGHGAEDTRVSVTDKSVTVRFEAARTTLSNDWRELFRFTQVSGYSPGVMLTGRLWDPDNRVHLALDAGLNLNLGLRERPIDWTLAPRLQIPLLRVAELGANFHSITDTSDRWRVGPLDSYVNAFFFNRPGREYYRRTGGEGFLTLHLLEQLTLGAEYRLDRYESLAALNPLWTVFNRGAGAPNAPITDGRFSSVVFRLEYSTLKAPLDRVGNPWRATETSLVSREYEGDPGSGFTTVDTVEVADERLGTDAGQGFLRVVSDNFLHLATGHDQGLRLRLRAAGGRNLPLQKQEALGGWNALRGYDFKEFRGDMSVLGMGEYHFGFLSVFADVGSVRQPAGWLVPKLGLGAALNFGSDIQLAAAWRTDERARWVPEARLLLQRTF